MTILKKIDLPVTKILGKVRDSDIFTLYSWFPRANVKSNWNLFGIYLEKVGRHELAYLN